MDKRIVLPFLLLFLPLQVSKATPPPSDPLPLEARPGFLLSGAFFEGARPLPARLLLVRPPRSGEDLWTVEKLEAGDGTMVFHKSMEFEPRFGSPGILTVAGSKAPVPACAKIWRKLDGEWAAETVFQGTFGGSFDRCRDVEVGDVDGDGEDEIVIVTHQRGVVLVVEQTSDGFVPLEIDGTRESGEAIWIHEVELGDVDGDGVLEIFATPSAPNMLGGTTTPSKIVMYRFTGEQYEKSIIDEFEARNVKEILCHDLDGTGRPILLASLEAARGRNRLRYEDRGVLMAYRWDSGSPVGSDIAEIPGKMCRNLVTGDLDGDGTPEVYLPTAKNGIHAVVPGSGGLQVRAVATSEVSSGFEHSALCLDWDGDGRDELFVVSDRDKTLQRFTHDPHTRDYVREKLLRFEIESMFIFHIESFDLNRY